MRTLLLMQGVPGAGKAQPLYSKILLSNGSFTTMGKIKVGDEVFDGNGKKTKVIGVYPQGIKDIYEIVTQDGRITHACIDHLWKVRSAKQRAKYNFTKNEKYQTIRTTKELISEIENKDIKRRSHIPIVKPIEYFKKDLKIPPYILGCLLGDGYLSEKGTLGFSNIEKDIIEKMRIYIESIGMNLKKNNGNNCTYSITYKINYLSPLKENLIYYKLLGKKSYNKFIPQDYLLSSIEDRMELLKGLMDTDGSVNKNKYTYSTTSCQLKDDILTLIRSLGMIATVSVDNRKYANSECSYSINIQTNNIIVSSIKHLSKLQHKYRYYNHIYIKSIKYIGEKECQCIMVDSDDKTYITDDFIVTHNTTWIKENNLEQYTLSADNIRTMLSSPILNENGKMSITQKNDKYVWDLLFQILENRMKNGDFTVIDATHNNDKTIKRYKELCDLYKYTMFIKRVDTPLEQCLINNKNRYEYKNVPEDKIRLMYNRIQNMKKLSWFNYIDDISEINNFYTEDMNKYNEVFVIGDIHGCIEPLNDFFKQHPFNDNSAYIFLGDYIDRGLDNLEVMKKMIELSQYTNVFLLEGNHENVLLPFSKGIPSGKNSFDKYTAPELESIPKKDIKLFYKKLRQCMRISYKGYEYLLTHGGLPCNPKNLTYISTNQLIKGVGDYDSDIDRSWLENESTVIQIHGHRSYKNYPNSCSLENEVEFGGWLNYAELSDNGFTIYSIKNNKFKQTQDNSVDLQNRKGLNTPNKTINDMSRNRMIKCKKLDNNIVSINFTKSCFKKKSWNDLTVKARGLFVNKETGDIVGRGYEKFFNFRERQDTTLKYIEDNYQFPLYCYKKYNGYLGIISHNNGELIFFSKTTNVGEKAERFKEIFYKYTTNSFRETLLNILIQYNCSLTCEVVDILYDPHIIDSDINEEIHMLNLIENTLEYNNLEDIFKKEISSRLLSDYDYHREHISAKELCNIIADKNDLKDWIKKAKSEVDSEGYVIQSSNNKQIFKLKTEYYNEWKSCRYLMNRIQKQNGYFEIRLSQSPLQVQFGKWYSDNFDKLKDIDNIISLRNRFESDMKVLKNYIDKIHN